MVTELHWKLLVQIMKIRSLTKDFPMQYLVHKLAHQWLIQWIIYWECNKHLGNGDHKLNHIHVFQTYSQTRSLNACSKSSSNCMHQWKVYLTHWINMIVSIRCGISNTCHFIRVFPPSFNEPLHLGVLASSSLQN